MQTSTGTDEINANASTKMGTVYHCICGSEYRIDISQGGQCPHCLRRVSVEAIQNAISATVSISNLNSTEELHHFDVDAQDSLSNQVFGHFRLERRLGGGGMGAVYRALDMSLQRYVAVKVMKDPQLCATTRVKAILREAVAQARLNHPNVVTIYYVGRQDEEPFLAMELLAGPTLGERLKSEGSIPYAEAIRYAIQVVSALEHAWQFDIVHADIKPANLIVSSDGQIKLSDFGLSRMKNVSDDHAAVSGTPAYVAPELLQGVGFSIQSDMYALGVTLFELIFGRPPFELVGVTVRERLETHLSALIDYPASWPNHIPREFKLLIDRMLAKKPEDRYATYEELRTDLNAIEPVNTTTAGIAPRAMAYVADQTVLLLLMSPFTAAIYYVTSRTSGKLLDYQWISPVVAFLSLIVPTIYLIAIYRGWKSIGRYLFQLRIVEENGLAPRREQLVPREVLRNAFAWFAPLAYFFSLNSPMLGWIILYSVLFFLVIDSITIIWMRGRKALHDFLCHSQVVLATDRNESL